MCQEIWSEAHNFLRFGKCFPGAFVGAPLGPQFLVVPGGLAGGTMYVVHIFNFFIG